MYIFCLSTSLKLHVDPCRYMIISGRRYYIAVSHSYSVCIVLPAPYKGMCILMISSSNCQMPPTIHDDWSLVHFTLKT